MKHLTLLRHAKAAGGTTELDHARALTARGRAAASALGEALAGQHRPPPGLVLCSTAARTRETFALFAAAWAVPVPVSFEHALYLAEAELLLRRLSEVEDGIDDVWVIGHNPGLHELACHLADHADNWSRFPQLSQGFPTAARIRFSLGIAGWAELPGAAPHIEELAFPRAD